MSKQVSRANEERLGGAAARSDTQRYGEPFASGRGGIVGAGDGDAARRTRAAFPQEGLPARQAFLVSRRRLLLEISTQGPSKGITVVYGPWGFGKTALLLQYVNEVLANPKRGSACIIDAAGSTAAELMMQIDEVVNEFADAPAPLVAIDDVPVYKQRETEDLVRRLQRMRRRGIEVAVACEPPNRLLLRLCGDALKIGPQALLVSPREYADWAETFTIPSSLDIYRLTQGVPLLVAALCDAGVRGPHASELLESCVAKLYRHVFDELAEDDGEAWSLAAMMVLMGEGTMANLERAGLAIRAEHITKLAHDYPVFGVERETNRFQCLGDEDASQLSVGLMVVQEHAEAVHAAVRALMACGTVDRAAWIVEHLADDDTAAEAVERYPCEFVAGGHADTVMTVCVDKGPRRGEDVTPRHALAAFVAAVATGDVRRARRAVIDLGRDTARVERSVDRTSWERARAMSTLWGVREGATLPDIPFAGPAEHDEMAEMYRLHARCLACILTHTRVPEEARGVVCDPWRGPFDLPRYLVAADVMLSDALRRGIFLDERDRAATLVEAQMAERNLMPAAIYVRMVKNAARLLAGVDVADERAFVDAGSMAVRISQTDVQLLSMVLEGWQALLSRQVVTAQFRGQQIVRLADTEHPFIAEWALLLEQVAHVCNTSRTKLCEEASLLDLNARQATPLRAWSVLFLLSAAQLDAQVSAWYSRNKEELADPSLVPLVRLALIALGDRADAVRRVLPSYMGVSYDAPAPAGSLVDITGVVAPVEAVDDDQVVISLFGGFKAERGGHVMVNEKWRRKKATAMMARLVLALGAFVPRGELAAEFWPGCEYRRARRNLYSTLSTLRAAIGQRKQGPQYLLAQGGGISINTEYISSDVQMFDRLVREVLLHHANIGAPQTIELCLKVEQVYKGPLFMPEQDARPFFLNMRRMLSSKFADCMIRGITAALEEDDLSSALWMAEAALRQEPTREDVMRMAMTVYARDGRRRELVELYESHLHYLSEEARGLPEPETQALYNELIQELRNKGIM